MIEAQSCRVSEAVCIPRHFQGHALVRNRHLHSKQLVGKRAKIAIECYVCVISADGISRFDGTARSHQPKGVI